MDNNQLLTVVDGLPPLPKSLSAFSLVKNNNNNNNNNKCPLIPPPPPITPIRTSSIIIRHHGHEQQQQKTLDGHLTVLRREMYSLRQLDLSLLAQLWSLNENLQNFRQILQEQRVLAVPSPSSTTSSEEEYFK